MQTIMCVHLIVAGMLGGGIIFLIGIWYRMSRYTNRIKEVLNNEKNNIESIRKQKEAMMKFYTHKT